MLSNKYRGRLVVPLSHAELSGHAVGLVLNHIRHKVWTQFDIGPPVASHIIIIGGREEGEDLMKHNSFQLMPQQHSQELFPCQLSNHLPVVAELVTLLFALMGADDELQVVLVQELLGDVRAPVAASASHFVRNAAVLDHRVTPQQVQDLHVDKNI